MTKLEDFMSRLKQANIIEGIDYIIENITNCENGIKCTIKVYWTDENKENCNKNILAVQGLIYHFVNRNWIISDEYMYIQQSMHTIKFNLN